jgi:diphthine synthase
MFYLIGLGLGWQDISLKGLEALHTCDKVYLEGYTSFSNFSVSRLSKLIGKDVIVLDRKGIEEDKEYLEDGNALLVFGDALAATTHSDVIAEAKKKGIDVEIIHGASVFTAVAETGLFLYKFGKVGSIPFWTKNFKPASFFDVYEDNLKINAHTLFLLDMNPLDEKFLSIKEALDMLLDVSKGKLTKKSMVIGCARLGFDTEIVYGTAQKVMKYNFGDGPYCLIIPAELNFKEEEFLKKYLLK